MLWQLTAALPAKLGRWPGALCLIGLKAGCLFGVGWLTTMSG